MKNTLIIGIFVAASAAGGFLLVSHHVYAQESFAVVAATQKIATPPSFGGRVVAEYPYCLNGGIWVTIIPAGGDTNPFYIWTPATITKLAGPPEEGEEILGLADTEYICIVSYYPYIQMPPGQRMLLVGTSAI